MSGHYHRRRPCRIHCGHYFERSTRLSMGQRVRTEAISPQWSDLIAWQGAEFASEPEVLLHFVTSTYPPMNCRFISLSNSERRSLPSPWGRGIACEASTAPGVENRLSFMSLESLRTTSRVRLDHILQLWIRPGDRAPIFLDHLDVLFKVRRAMLHLRTV